MIVKLKDVCTKIGSGATPKGGANVYIKSGTSFIRSQNIYNLYFNYDGLTYITEEAANKLKGVTVQESDVLINITGDSVARTCIVPSDILPARVNQHVAIIRPDEKLLRARFLNYYLASPYMQAYMLSLAVGKGASRNAMTKDMIGNFEVPCPKTDIQDKIISILSAYDQLIVNNQKQIKLLEEAAQRLHKEWFVDFRFPGYEDVDVIDGVPEGWRKGILDDIANNVGKKEKKENREKYAYYLPVDCMPKRSLSYMDSNDIALAESSLIAFRPKDILFGAMRPYFHKVVIARDKGLTRSTCFVINSKREIMWTYLIMLLFSNDTINYATRISVGTTMPYVRWKDFIQMPVLIPNEKLCKKFQGNILPMINKMLKLSELSIRLVESRNRLLPKLLSRGMEL